MKIQTFLKSSITPLILICLLATFGCTGLPERGERDASIRATFVEGAPGDPEIVSDEEPSHSCIAVERSSSRVPLKIRLVANDPNGLEWVSINTSRRQSNWLPPSSIENSEPGSRIIRGGGEHRIVFEEAPPEGEVQISMLALVDIAFEPMDTFNDPAEIFFTAMDVNGNSTRTPSVDLRREFDPPPATTVGVFACMNGTAR